MSYVFTVLIQFEWASGLKVTAKLAFVEIQSTKWNFLNIFLGHWIKVKNWNCFHAIVREEILFGLLKKGDLFHFCVLKEDVLDLKQKLKGRSSLVNTRACPDGPKRVRTFSLLMTWMEMKPKWLTLEIHSFPSPRNMWTGLVWSRSIPLVGYRDFPDAMSLSLLGSLIGVVASGMNAGHSGNMFEVPLWLLWCDCWCDWVVSLVGGLHSAFDVHSPVGLSTVLSVLGAFANHLKINKNLQISKVCFTHEG